MQPFIILSCIAFACADHMRYNYNPGSYSNNGVSFGPAASAGAPYEVQANSYLAAANSDPSKTASSYSSSSGIAPSYTPQLPFAPSHSSPSYSASSYTASSYSAPSYSARSYSAPSYSAPFYSAPSLTDPSYSAPAELHKEFYTFTAPENEFEDTNAIERIVGSVKQGLRVIFIKGPENKAFEDAALALAQQAAQQQTAIYVLNKQADIANLANKFNTVNQNVNSKPDVHFVKYRTPEDAVNAQRSIQSKYDSLGGNSQNINGGIAPVINFASQHPIHTTTAQQPQNAYLPSSALRFRI